MPFINRGECPRLAIGTPNPDGWIRFLPHDGFLMLSMRRWAEVMNQAYGNQHNFYMAAVCDIQEKLPNE